MKLKAEVEEDAELAKTRRDRDRLELANRQLKETVQKLETENDTMAAKLVEMTIKLSEALEEAERLRAIADDDIETRM